ncbi:non-homologous end-joining DNA ligase [Alicyclobacillus fastidiosus]|uniref:Non-homologous end-joining DNA ligase n=1 Tax=Alicyclobacillus fastidiosus TaxID=392011 RepID=A0ABY6ZAX4_9BACL|nr:non-homologous end-joining DNA ligase [Alicyclobacillus fastidiosus]WAH39682.1 non-homologous end-joining DNA ligase [Alicyclobacillus fastidiosus]GMA60895.1 ATP-dependent DNA ligase [Alicyclobacillus fastidiosus]
MARHFVLQADVPVRVTHPDKILFPDPPTTKLAYITYVAQMAHVILPHLRNRRVTLVRCPNGTRNHRFYQRHVLAGAPEWIPSVPGEEGKPEIVIPNVATLLYYANLGAIEFHSALSYIDESAASVLSFDLDPSTDDFERLRTVALYLHDVLLNLGLVSLLKTSGKRGLQVFIPLSNPVPFALTRKLVHFVGQYMQQRWPTLATTARLVKDRGDKVYIDVPQHGAAKTLVCVYSVRATDDARVSTPITWDELRAGCHPADFTMRTVPARVKQQGDLFEPKQRCDIRGLLEKIAEHS